MIEKIRRFLIPALGVTLSIFTVFEVNFARITPLSQLAFFAMFGLSICFQIIEEHHGKKMQIVEMRTPC